MSVSTQCPSLWVRQMSFSVHIIYLSLGFCSVGWDGDSHFLEFYMILISSMEHISYLMTFSPYVSNMSAVISTFGDIVDNCCT